MNVILFDPDDANTLEFVEKNLRILQSAMGKSSCMRLVGDKELPELTPNEEDSLVRAVVTFPISPPLMNFSNITDIK